MRAWKEGLNFRELVARDPDITSRVPAKVIEQAFDLKRQLRNIDGIFAQIFKPGTRLKAKPSKKSGVSRTASKRTK
jgi:adenylosuccinate lyase